MHPTQDSQHDKPYRHHRTEGTTYECCAELLDKKFRVRRIGLVVVPP